ncbi:MAG: 16S rRNA (adenine(1518)-N(6)/adenine(1519)-N(6))-dimethyltransferase RsmA [Pseudomonadota bacterium]
MGETDLPPLREVIATHGLAAKKSLGQHFLLDLNITRKIARMAEIGAGDVVLEIGPGPGGLTRALLETEAAAIIAIERDGRAVAALQDLKKVYGTRFHLIEADAMDADEAALIAQTGAKRAHIAANLPYNISTALLVKWLTVRPRWWASLSLMFQKEVADRILAPPGSKTYGRLSVLSQAAAAPQRLFDLPARAFTPPPKVASAVVRFTSSEAPPDWLPNLSAVTAAAFSQRRKMLRSSLKSVAPGGVETLLRAAGLEETARAEDVSVEGYIALARASAKM